MCFFFLHFYEGRVEIDLYYRLAGKLTAVSSSKGPASTFYNKSKAWPNLES